MSRVYETARRLAAKGITIFPCRPDAKVPLTQHGFRDASTDRGVIDVWKRCWPRANLAVATGLRSGMLVIDIDRKGGRDGFDTLAAMEEELGALPATLTAATPNGGEHRWFRMASVSVRSSAGRLGAHGESASGVDVRAEGGYALVAPSVVDGRAYYWLHRCAVAELPGEWVKVLAGPVRTIIDRPPSFDAMDPKAGSRQRAWCIRALQYEARTLAATSSGARNDQLWRAAAALGGLVHLGVYDADDVRRALEWACSCWTDRTPGKDADTLERGLSFGLQHPRQLNRANRHAS